jgi:hypothetical protein
MELQEATPGLLKKDMLTPKDTATALVALLKQYKEDYWRGLGDAEGTSKSYERCGGQLFRQA